MSLRIRDRRKAPIGHKGYPQVLSHRDGGSTGKGKSIMAVSESRQVPAVLYDVDEAAEALRLSRSVLYELIRSGRLRTVKQGRRRLVPVSALAEYVNSLEGGV
jgi:excisionase family DNA binding protein